MVLGATENTMKKQKVFYYIYQLYKEGTTSPTSGKYAMKEEDYIPKNKENMEKFLCRFQQDRIKDRYGFTDKVEAEKRLKELNAPKT